MRCLIVDDEEMSRVHIQGICQRIPDIEIVGIFDNALAANAYLSQHPVDLIFLDIEMPDCSGIEFVKNMEQVPGIIFTTAKENYAIKAFDLIDHVVDYIVKPVASMRLLRAIQRFKAQRSGEAEIAETTSAFPTPAYPSDDFIFVKSEKRLVRINLEELLYVETTGDYSIFKLQNGQQFVVQSSLKKIGNKIQHPNFIKVHRSYIVNLNKIVDIEENTLVIDRKVIPISRAHRAGLLERIMPI
ncbi:MAG: LytTR family DNA-binding domain-containing protein [Saprospiraceae bacterium]|nr:LytTR family DNA-binding domain-containing protein [Saprospiraceae bacterium]